MFKITLAPVLHRLRFIDSAGKRANLSQKTLYPPWNSRVWMTDCARCAIYWLYKSQVADPWPISCFCHTSWNMRVTSARNRKDKKAQQSTTSSLHGGAKTWAIPKTLGRSRDIYGMIHCVIKDWYRGYCPARSRMLFSSTDAQLNCSRWRTSLSQTDFYLISSPSRLDQNKNKKQIHK